MTQNNLPVIIELDDQRFEIAPEQLDRLDCHQKNDGIYILKDGDHSFEIKLLNFDLISGTCTISIDGQVKEIRIVREINVLIEKMGINSLHAKEQSIINAPMPGMVTNIKVAEGDHVEKGTPLIILEVMKMENVISAPHEAVIKKIRVTMGQAVERGLPLVEFT